MKKIFYVMPALLIALIAYSGCNRKVDSLDPVRSLPDPLAAPINVTALIGDRAVTLTWEMPITTGVSYYRIYIADSSNGEFILRDTSYALTQTITGLLYNHGYSLAVAAVRSGGDEGKRSSVVEVRVPALSVVLQNNAEFTLQRTVNVTMNAGQLASEFQLSEDSTFPIATSPIQNFTAQTQFELSSGDAKKRVYARFYYADGARTNAAVFDEITLDTRAQIGSFLFSPGSIFQTGETITFTLTSGETKGTASVGFIGAPTIFLYDDGIFPDATANDAVYTGRYLIPVNASASGVEVTADFTDAAGNDALRATAPALLTIQPTPQPVSIVSTIAISTYQITINWTQATTPIFQAYRLYRANNSNVNTTSTLVTSNEARAAASHTDTALAANTMYYYRVYLIDSFGFSAASNVDSARTQVNSAPVAVTLAGTLADSSRFRLTWTQSNETDFESYRLYRKNSPGVTTADQLVEVFNNQETDNFSNFVPGSVTLYYRIFVFDRHGLNTGSNEIQLTK